MTSIYKKLYATNENNEFIIEEDLPDVGWYLKVYENEKCIKDHLQNTLRDAIEFAEIEYQLPSKSWKEK